MSLIFTQAGGFSDYETPESLNLGDGDFDEEMERVGFKQIWRQNGYELKDVSRFGDDVMAHYTAGSSVGYEYAGPDASVPKYMVEVGDGQAGCVWVHVPTLGDLLALRIQLAQLINASTIGVIEDVRVILSRTLCVTHRHHQNNGCCMECDPEEAAYRGEKDVEKPREKLY